MKQIFFCLSLFHISFMLPASKAAPSSKVAPSVPSLALMLCRNSRLHCRAEIIGSSSDVLLRQVCKKGFKDTIICDVSMRVKILSMIHVMIEGTTPDRRESIYAACLPKMKDPSVKLTPEDYSDAFMRSLPLDELEQEAYEQLSKPKVSILETEIEIRPVKQSASLSPRISFRAGVSKRKIQSKNITYNMQNCTIFDAAHVRLMVYDPSKSKKVPARPEIENIRDFLNRPNVKEVLRREEYGVFKKMFLKEFPLETVVLFTDEEQDLSGSDVSEEYPD